jgi:hypothetical protein
MSEVIQQMVKDQILLTQSIANLGWKFVNEKDNEKECETLYLTQCNRYLHQHLLKYFKTDFLFCSFSYLNNNNTFSSVPYLFYSDIPYSDDFKEDYWKAVSWYTNIPDNTFSIPDIVKGIMGVNYVDKQIPRIKELIWYLIDILLLEQKILASTELTLYYGGKDPKSLLIFNHNTKSSSENFENNEQDRFWMFDLNKFDVPVITNTKDFEIVKGYSKIPNTFLDILRTENFNYNAQEEPNLTDDKLVSYLKQIYIYKLIGQTNKFKDFYFYFLKTFSHFTAFRGVFLLGFNRKLELNEILFLESLNYRILSNVVLKRIERLIVEKENLKYQKSINYTVHQLKTTIEGLFSDPLQQLKELYPENEEIKMLIESKDIVLSTASVLNLITKVEEDSNIDISDLINSHLFSNKKCDIDINNVLYRISKHRKGKKDSRVNLIPEKIIDFVQELYYKNIYPSNNFYLLFFLTLTENANEHGLGDYETGIVDLHLNYDSIQREFFAWNIARNDSPVPEIESVKGNIKLFNALLRILKIGYIYFRKEKNEKNESIFYTILKLNNNVELQIHSHQYFMD